MRKFYLIIVLFIGFKALAVTPPVIQNPSPLQVCDINNDNFEVFDLTIKIPEVLGALNPTLFNVTFHETFTDADVGANPITNPTAFYNIVPNSQIIYIRVTEINSNEYSITTLQLIINPTPTAGQPIDLFRDQPISNGNSAQFDFTDNYTLLYDGQTGMELQFYTSLADAESGTNQIPTLTVPAYSASSGTQIWARVQNATTGCYTIRTFRLFVTHPGVVFIPDANFKARLLAANGATQIAEDLNYGFTVIDTNGDGEIQYSEAHNIALLDASQSNIGDFTGLEAFINLVNLDVSYNFGVTFINVSTMPLLERLSTSHCALTNLNLANNHNLQLINCEYSNLLSLDFSSCPLMTNIHCQNNQLVDLNLQGLTQLTDLVASDNHIGSIYTTDLHSIQTFNVANNSLSSLDLTGLGTLQQLICEYNSIDSLNTTNCTNLVNLRCAANQMTYLDVLHSTLLYNLDCSSNTLINLDLSQNSALCGLNCSGNITMNSLNIKNGVDTCYTNFNVLFINNVLQQFCCDDNEVTYFKNYFLTNQGINVNVNSYCSFTPGGDYNTINASTQFDENNNGCDTNDSSFPNVRFNISDGTNSGASFTGTNGVAQFYTQAGSFVITPNIENPTWFSISPLTVTIPFSNTNNNTVNQNFCIAPNGNHTDIEVAFEPLTTARPGFDADYLVVIKNKGNQILSQSNGIVITYDATKLDFLFAGETPSSAGSGTLSWNYVNLSPFESKSIYVSMHVHAPTDSGPVNNGDILAFNANVNPITGDENPNDNSFQYNQTVVGSFDPNEIICLEGNIVSPIEIGNYLHYTINFENTGTADAENIVVREVIDTTQFDLGSLQLLDSSASVTTRLMGNVAEFIFPSINLHSGGHGNILLKIKSNNTLVQGDNVSKKASIYFDYNFPVDTNMEITTFQTLSITDQEIDASISIYPNPTKGNVNINCQNNIKSIQLFDVQGRLLQTDIVNETNKVIDISTKAKGIYFLKILSDKGSKVEKIVRE